MSSKRTYQEAYAKRLRNLIKEAKGILEASPDMINEVEEDLWAIYEKTGADLEEQYGKANRFKTLANELQLMVSETQDSTYLGEIVDVLTAADILKKWALESKKREDP